MNSQMRAEQEKHQWNVKLNQEMPMKPQPYTGSRLELALEEVALFREEHTNVVQHQMFILDISHKNNILWTQPVI